MKLIGIERLQVPRWTTQCFVSLLACALLSGCWLISPPIVVDNRTGEPAPPVNSPTFNGKTAVSSTVRVVCNADHTQGTGFMHKSGWIITAAHVIADCPSASIRLQLSDGREMSLASPPRFRREYDLAVLQPTGSLEGMSVLQLSDSRVTTKGEQIEIWGYTENYEGAEPLETVGYVSGYDPHPTYQDGDAYRPFACGLWIVNAAINKGNSGGLAIRVDDGSIIGVVVRKQTAYTNEIKHAIELQVAKHTEEADALAKALEDLRVRSQFDIGYLVPGYAVRNFLTDEGFKDP